jgi:hypothetical protein
MPSTLHLITRGRPLGTPFLIEVCLQRDFISVFNNQGDPPSRTRRTSSRGHLTTRGRPPRISFLLEDVFRGLYCIAVKPQDPQVVYCKLQTEVQYHTFSVWETEHCSHVSIYPGRFQESGIRTYCCPSPKFKTKWQPRDRGLRTEEAECSS